MSMEHFENGPSQNARERKQGAGKVKKRILIVDDDPDSTRLLKSLLEKNGEYLVKGENDEMKAFETTKLFKPDLILLDVLMPSLDGATLAARIRSDPAFAGVPIIFLTGIVPKQEMFNQDSLGSFPLLAKPACIEDVREAIKANLT